MPEYSLYETTGSRDLGPWIEILIPQTTTIIPEEAWSTSSLEEATEDCPSGFSVGPKPHPHH